MLVYHSSDPARDAECFMADQDRAAAELIVGRCAHCGEDVFAYEVRYQIGGELVHDDCLYSWAAKYKAGDT